MFKAKKIRRSLCLQSLIFLLVIDFFRDRYFVIIHVPSFEFIVVFVGSFPTVFEKLFSHSNPLNNLVYQPIRVFCSHPVKVNLDKRMVHSVSHLQSQQMFCTKVGFMSMGVKGLLPLPLGIPYSYLNCLKSLSPLYKVALCNPTRKI